MSPRLLAVLAVLAVAPPAGAFVRSTDPDTGACLYWAPRSVQYQINPTRAGTSPTCGPLSATDSGAANAVRAGFAAWGEATLSGASQACTDLTLVEGPVTSAIKIGYDQQGGPNENLVVFRRGWCSEDPAAEADPCFRNPAVRCSDTYGCFENTGSLGGTQIIALTTTTYASSTGQIVDADMEFVDWSGSGSGTAIGSTQLQGWYYTCFEPAAQPNCSTYGQADCKGMDIQNTATHEAGHFIGLAHVGVAGATMLPTAAVGETSKRSLADDDVSGVCAIYPRGGPTSVCVEQKPEDEGGCGCGSGGGSAVGLLSLLAVLALRPRRQRMTTPA